MLSPSGRPTFDPASTTGEVAGKSSIMVRGGEDGGRWAREGLAANGSINSTGNNALPKPLGDGGSLSRDLGALPSLADRWETCNGGRPSQLQSLVLPAMMGYRDVLYSAWRDKDARELRWAYALHALNHTLTSRKRVIRHNRRIRADQGRARVKEALVHQEEEKEEDDQARSMALEGGINGQGKGTPAPAVTFIGDDSEAEAGDRYRDQGFTRPKVVVLLPFRGLAFEVVEAMVGILGPKTSVSNWERFVDEYGPADDEEGDNSNGEGGARAGARGEEGRAERVRTIIAQKPRDWQALMGEGRDVDDMFSMGMALTPGGGKGRESEGKGVGLRLYVDFYQSDIIVASPVALHRAAGGGGDDADSDFLSSVEVCILDRADVFLMQNWAFLPELVGVMNAQPSGQQAAQADFARVRPFLLHGQGRLFRQTIIFSAIQVVVSTVEQCDTTAQYSTAQG
ncbi:unnamed protein product [Discosporangium mesarthrocarpum]